MRLSAFSAVMFKLSKVAFLKGFFRVFYVDCSIKLILHPKTLCCCSSMNRHLIVEEEFACCNESRSYAVQGFLHLVGSPKAGWSWTKCQRVTKNDSEDPFPSQPASLAGKELELVGEDEHYQIDIVGLTSTPRFVVERVHIRFFRRVAGVSFIDRVRSSDIWEALKVEPLLLHVERRQLR